MNEEDLRDRLIGKQVFCDYGTQTFTGKEMRLTKGTQPPKVIRERLIIGEIEYRNPNRITGKTYLSLFALPDLRIKDERKRYYPYICTITEGDIELFLKGETIRGESIKGEITLLNDK